MYCENCRHWVDGICMEDPIIRVVTAPSFCCRSYKYETDDEDDL